jgi:hypothetical protein
MEKSIVAAKSSSAQGKRPVSRRFSVSLLGRAYSVSSDYSDIYVRRRVEKGGGRWYGAFAPSCFPLSGLELENRAPFPQLRLLVMPQQAGDS